MLISDLFVVFFLVLIGWLWWLDRGVKQKAYVLAKSHCEQSEVQLLDDNIRLNRLTLKRDDRGYLRIFREFKFEFTSTGEFRYQGSIAMLGNHNLGVELAPSI